MKYFITILVLSLQSISTISAKSRVLIDEKNFEKCSVEIEENYFFGVLAAKKEVENIRFVNFDSLIYIESRDRKNTCNFVFDVYSKQEFIGRAEIVLSKPNWQKISRTITKGNDTARW